MSLFIIPIFNTYVCDHPPFNYLNTVLSGEKKELGAEGVISLYLYKRLNRKPELKRKYDCLGPRITFRFFMNFLQRLNNIRL
jgi:hypothetical protein